MKNPGQISNVFGPGSFMNGDAKDSLKIRHYLEGIPSVRPDRVTRTQRLLASGRWLPQADALVDRLLFEHLLGPLQS